MYILVLTHSFTLCFPRCEAGSHTWRFSYTGRPYCSITSTCGQLDCLHYVHYTLYSWQYICSALINYSFDLT